MLVGSARYWVVVAGLALAACSSGGESTQVTTTPSSTSTTEEPPATDPPAATEPTTPTTEATTTTVAATTTSTEPPPPALPELVTQSRLVVTGPEEVVFDWTSDQCEPEHIPDIAARAYGNADGEVQLTIGHYVTYRMIGPSLNDVVTDCSQPQLQSNWDPDPSQFNDSEWIGAPYTLDGETVYAVAHNEYRGDTHGSARPGQCPSGQRLPCLDTSFTMMVSNDGGDTFDHVLPPPNHLIATMPYEYRDDSVPSGIRQPSNIIQGPDDYYYLFGNISDQPAEDQWVCVMRTDDLADPASWRYWDGNEFAGVWKNPYLEPLGLDPQKCAPLAFPQLSGSLNEGIVYDEALERYIIVGISDHPAPGEDRWGVYYATSENLIDWTLREGLIELPVTASVADSGADMLFAYPSIIDPDSTSLNFETSDGEMYLYVSRFNFGGGSLDRDLLRYPIAIEEYAVGAPDWTFDAGRDIDSVLGGWVGVNDVEPLTVVDGVLAVRPTGTDPFIENYSVRIPSTYNNLVITMRADAGVENIGQLFWTTGADPALSESKSLIFEYTGTGDFVDYEIDLAEYPGWSGTIVALRFDPIEGATNPIDIERIHFPTN